MPFADSDGFPLYYMDEGVGPPMILIHGATCDSTTFSAEFEHFAGDHRVIAPDLPGHGRSGSLSTSRSVGVKDCGDLIGWLCDHLGIESAVVLGHSFGGRVALSFAADRTDLVSSLILLDSGLVLLPDAHRSFCSLLDRLQASSGIEPWVDSVRASFLETDDPVLRDNALKIVSSTDRTTVISVLTEMTRFDRSICADLLSRATVPILNILSTVNTATDTDYLTAVRPDFHFARVACSGHFIQMVVPGQVNEMITHFIGLFEH